MLSYFIAYFLTRPAHSKIARLKQISGHDVKRVKFKARDGVKLSAWFVSNPKSDKAVILLSGIRSNREAQIKRAQFYLNRGYTVLMPDLRGTGRSEGNFISFGWHERKDLQAAVFFLRKKGYKKVSAHGQSLGAATIAYAHKEFQGFEFIVMESCYDNINHAFQHRMEKYLVPRIFYAGVFYFVERKIQASHFSLRPERFVKNFVAPTLFMAGDSEKVLPLPESQKIYKFCTSKFKQFVIFQGADHEDLYENNPVLFERTMDAFLIEIDNLNLAQSA
jgi:alpha-beta hydrolase superfamily lysophospholipase